MNKKGIQVSTLTLFFSLALVFALRALLLDAFLPESRPGKRGVGADFDGDAAADLLLLSDSHLIVSGSGGLEGSSIHTSQKTALSLKFKPTPFGIPLSGDFNGDSFSDLAFFNPNADPSLDHPANWEIWYTDPSLLALGNSSPLSSLPARYSWGLASAIAVPADYDGDGRTDLGVFDRPSGVWSIAFLNREPNFAKAALGLEGFGIRVQWGLPGDVPLPADFSGDGKADFAVVRGNPRRGAALRWLIKVQGRDAPTEFDFGFAGDLPFAADVQGDGAAEAILYRPPGESDKTGLWLARDPENTWSSRVEWCEGSSKPFVGDFDADGRADLGCFSEGVPARWKIRLSQVSDAGRELLQEKGPQTFGGVAEANARLAAVILSEHQRSLP